MLGIFYIKIWLLITREWIFRFLHICIGSMQLNKDEKCEQFILHIMDIREYLTNFLNLEYIPLLFIKKSYILLIS